MASDVISDLRGKVDCGEQLPNVDLFKEVTFWKGSLVLSKIHVLSISIETF